MINDILPQAMFMAVLDKGIGILVKEVPKRFPCRLLAVLPFDKEFPVTIGVPPVICDLVKQPLIWRQLRLPHRLTILEQLHRLTQQFVFHMWFQGLRCTGMILPSATSTRYEYSPTRCRTTLGPIQ